MPIKMKYAKAKPPGGKKTPADSTAAFVKSSYLSPNTRESEAVHALTLKDNKNAPERAKMTNAQRSVIRQYNNFVRDAKEQGTMNPSLEKRRIRMDSVRRAAIRKSR